MAIRRSPLNSVMASEGLRQAVGLTLAENQITVLLLDAAAWLATPLAPERLEKQEVKKHIDFLLQLHGQVKVEAESLTRYSIPLEKVRPDIAVVPRSQVVEEMTQAEAVILF